MRWANVSTDRCSWRFSKSGQKSWSWNRVQSQKYSLGALVQLVMLEVWTGTVVAEAYKLKSARPPKQPPAIHELQQDIRASLRFCSRILLPTWPSYSPSSRKGYIRQDLYLCVWDDLARFAEELGSTKCLFSPCNQKTKTPLFHVVFLPHFMYFSVWIQCENKSAVTLRFFLSFMTGSQQQQPTGTLQSEIPCSQFEPVLFCFLLPCKCLTPV